jgi:phosphoglycolate phosphatase-like HAD superfamily hydrolase
MGRKSKKKALDRFNRQRWVDAASGLWDLAANRQNPNALRILAEMIGLDKIALLLLLKSAGDKSVDAEAVNAISGAIERDQNLRR